MDVTTVMSPSARPIGGTVTMAAVRISGTVATKKPHDQLPSEEIGRMLDAVREGFDKKYSTNLVDDGIDTPELLRAASSIQLFEAGVPHYDATLIMKQLKIASLRFAPAGSIGERDLEQHWRSLRGEAYWRSLDSTPGEANEGKVTGGWDTCFLSPGAVSQVYLLSVSYCYLIRFHLLS